MEGTTKTVKTPGHAAGDSKFKKLPYYQKEYTSADREFRKEYGIIDSMRLNVVSYTFTVKKKSRFHIAYQLPVHISYSKPRKDRGKYRSASTTINGVRVNTVLWSDSALIAYDSADLAGKKMSTKRQQGRDSFEIACPEMVVVRGDHFRAADSHDQLRLGRCPFCFVV